MKEKAPGFWGLPLAFMLYCTGGALHLMKIEGTSLFRLQVVN